MTPLVGRVRAAMFARSFAIQGSWNFRTLIGTGFGFVLLPALRAIYRDQPDELDAAIRRHCQIFNSHPYVAGIAVGAVARLEAEHTDPAVIERFKSAVRGSLGGIGDRLVWAGWRPVCVLLALGLVFAGAPWWAGALFLVASYNVGHIALRVWSFRMGLDHGKFVGERLRRSRIAEAQRALAGAGAFALGLVLPLAMTGGLVGARPTTPAWIVAVGTAGVLLGLRFGNAIRTPVVLALAAFALLGLLLGSLR
ncbi:MAG: PTS system mannose/fructose/sorbose family transporter subunit IID [Longimicrobiales bacterium]